LEGNALKKENTSKSTRKFEKKPKGGDRMQRSVNIISLFLLPNKPQRMIKFVRPSEGMERIRSLKTWRQKNGGRHQEQVSARGG